MHDNPMLRSASIDSHAFRKIRKKIAKQYPNASESSLYRLAQLKAALVVSKFYIDYDSPHIGRLEAEIERLGTSG
jgi:hypothetical protein